MTHASDRADIIIDTLVDRIAERDTYGYLAHDTTYDARTGGATVTIEQGDASVIIRAHAEGVLWEARQLDCPVDGGEISAPDAPAMGRAQRVICSVLGL